MSTLSSIDVYKVMEPCICSVHTPIGKATGFFVNETGMLTTALHIIQFTNGSTNSEQIKVRHGGKDHSVQFTAGTIETLKYRSDVDICLLQIIPQIQTKCMFLEKDISQLNIGTEVFFSGFPLSQSSLTFHKGMVSSIPPTINGICHFTIDGTIVQGNSGGPVAMISENRLVVIGMIFQEAAELSQDFYHGKCVLDGLRKEEKSSGFQTTITFPDGTTLTKSRSQFLANVIDTLVSNISTGIGKAIHTQHIIQMSRSEGIPEEEKSQSASSSASHLSGLSVMKGERVPKPMIDDSEFGDWVHKMKTNKRSQFNMITGRPNSKGKENSKGKANVTAEECVPLRLYYDLYNEIFSADGSNETTLRKKIQYSELPPDAKRKLEQQLNSQVNPKQKESSYKRLNQRIEALGNMIQKAKKKTARKPFDSMPEITRIKEKIDASDCNECERVELLQFLSLLKESEKNEEES